MGTTLTPGIRKLFLTAHVAVSVGWLGSIAVFLALAVTALTSRDAEVIRAMYTAMELSARLVIVPLAFVSILTGLVQSLGTAWGLFQHYWVAGKFVLTIFATVVLLAKMELIGHASRLAGETALPLTELDAAGMELAVHAFGGLLVLLAPAILSIYKPGGLTPFGRRQRQQRREYARPDIAAVSSPRHPVPAADAVKGSSSGAITITLRPSHIASVVAVAVILHIIALHIAGFGLGGH